MLIYQRVCLKISTHRWSMFETRGSPLKWPKKSGGETNPLIIWRQTQIILLDYKAHIVSNQTMPFYCCFGMVWSPQTMGGLGEHLRLPEGCRQTGLLLTAQDPTGRNDLPETMGRGKLNHQRWRCGFPEILKMGCECKKWRMGLKSTQFHSRFDHSCFGQVNVAQNRTPGPHGQGRGREACRATQSLFPFTSSKPNSNRIPRPVSDLGPPMECPEFSSKMAGILDVHPQKFMETHIQLTPQIVFHLTTWVFLAVLGC